MFRISVSVLRIFSIQMITAISLSLEPKTKIPTALRIGGLDTKITFKRRLQDRLMKRKVQGKNVVGKKLVRKEQIINF